MRSLGWALIQYGWCPHKKRLGHRHTQREHHREKSVIYKPERAQKKSTLLMDRSWTSSLQNYENISVCCLSFPVCGTLLRQP